MYYAVLSPMPLAAQLKRWVLGSNLPNEYVCLKANSLPDALRAILILGNARIDVTDEHFLLGYKPLLIGVSAPRAFEISEGTENATLELMTGSGHLVASLDLVPIRRIRFGDDTLSIFEGRHGRHELLSRVRQAINNVYESTRTKSAGNIALEGNLYDQVRIGYAYPRVIAIISVGEGERVNLFPTDLHGPFGERHYAGSLRVGGQACNQVQQLGRLVISTVDAASFRSTYRLGKNHMRELTDVGQFEVAPFRSATFGLPLPKDVMGYRELQRIDGFDTGIHRIHFYETVHRVSHPGEAAALAHVHRYYAQWRADRGLSVPWLVR
jgi:flavin reductase (DIM6/NTAB) family NADH-FMN oxidoreductase RutF